MRVTLVISSLSRGGAERVLTGMANYWAEKGWTVSLLTLEDASVAPAYPLDGRVTRRGLGLLRPSRGLLDSILANLRRVRALRRAIAAASPEVVISFMDTTNVLALLACRGMGIPVIFSERTNPQMEIPRWPWRILQGWVYPKSYKIVVQTRAALDLYSPAIRKNCTNIPNPVPRPESFSALPDDSPTDHPEPRVLVAMGRLHPVKGFDLLLHAWGRIAPRHPQWRLEIWGEGPERDHLAALINSLGLSGRVSLPGVTDDAYGVFARSGIFVLSSRFEGFPNVLCEAMACGVPAVSFDCPNGPGEIIRHGHDGLLVPPGDADGLAEAIAGLIEDPEKRRRLGRHATEVSERFGLEKVMGQWEALLASIKEKEFIRT